MGVVHLQAISRAREITRRGRTRARSGGAENGMAFAASAPLSARTRAATDACTRAPARQRARRAHARMASASAGATRGLEAKWVRFAAGMKAANESPVVERWNELLDECVEAQEPPSKAIWVLSTMRATGRSPTVATYERALRVCAQAGDRAAAFHLVELMWQDDILLGDVHLPDAMEETLRTILPPEAFD